MNSGEVTMKVLEIRMGDKILAIPAKTRLKPKQGYHEFEYFLDEQSIETIADALFGDLVKQVKEQCMKFDIKIDLMKPVNFNTEKFIAQLNELAGQTSGSWVRDVIHILVEAFPQISVYKEFCPAKPCRWDRVDFVKALIPHLNDDHCWTREQIADWVETRDWNTPIKETE